MAEKFRKVVDRYRNSVYTFAYYSLGNKEEAEDTTQEVLMRLWRNWQDLKTETMPAWIRRVTRNACIDMIRRRRAYSARVVASGETLAFDHAVSNEPDPDVSAENSELRDQIRRALTTLKEPYRSIVIFREIQDMRYEQISESLDLPLNTVKSYLHRGRRMLREQLRETLHERG
ncbi:MAG: RNA polymerase sigma factor [Candidatus Krumholzibacteria bacterium]|nr:RNA polymerase sigma factor [Candidatus Krumholzibacteria bacterium]